MKRVSMMLLVALLLSNECVAGDPLAAGMDSYLRMREEYRQNQTHEQNLEMQRQQIRLQREQLELLKESDRREQLRHDEEVKRREENIRSRRYEEDLKQVQDFYDKYPQYHNDGLSKKLLDTVIEIKNKSENSNKSPAVLLLLAHNIIEKEKLEDQALWQKEQDDFFKRHSEYKKGSLRWNALNSLVIRLANMPENASKSGNEILEEAHIEVQKMK